MTDEFNVENYLNSLPQNICYNKLTSLPELPESLRVLHYGVVIIN
jgi:hypothetical protein